MHYHLTVFDRIAISINTSKYKSLKKKMLSGKQTTLFNNEVFPRKVDFLNIELYLLVNILRL